jgi:hypothetical protein
LFALEASGDPTVIDGLPASIMDSDELVVRQLLSTCKTLDAENPKSLDYFFEGTKRSVIEARYGLHAIEKKESLRTFLEKFNSDENFRKDFLDKASIFEDQDGVIVEHVGAVYDAEIGELCKRAIELSADYKIAFHAEKSAFISGLMRLLLAKDPNFISQLTQRITDPNFGTGRFFFEDLLASTMNKDEVPSFLDGMLAIGQAETAFSVMSRARFYRGAEGQEIFELGRSKLPDLYTRWEAEKAKQEKASADNRNKGLLAEFRTFSEPKPKQYNPNVLEYYNRNADELDPILENTDRQRLTSLITDEGLKNDPVTSTVQITTEQGGAKTYTTSMGAHMFGQALLAAKRLGINLSPFRQKIINFIPFAWGDQLKVILESVPQIKPQEIALVLDVYKKKHSDLWRHQPISFVEAVSEYQLREAAPVLKAFVKETAYDGYVRVRALNVLESLSPDAAFLQEVFDSYMGGALTEKHLAEEANALLITAYAEENAISWRIKEIVQEAQPLNQPSGPHFVGPIEEELRAKSFAKPLMDLKEAKYQDTFLQLLDDAMALWDKGAEYRAYSEYLQDIAFGYFDSLKENRSYDPLTALEKKIEELQTRDGGNWLVYRLEKLHRAYLAFVGKPTNIAEAVRKYNEARNFYNRNIRNSTDLFRHLQQAIETDLQRWIEGEGAYELIRTGEILRPGVQQYEKLIQKTLKGQIENILLRRGFQVEVYREAQLLDEKRIDFLVQYGFAGPIGIEIKLTSNSDMQAEDLKKSPSFASMQRCGIPTNSKSDSTWPSIAQSY